MRFAMVDAPRRGENEVSGKKQKDKELSKSDAVGAAADSNRATAPESMNIQVGVTVGRE